MERLTVSPGDPPVAAWCGGESSGAKVVNRAGGTVYYSDSKRDAEAGVSDGSVAAGSSVTLYGQQFFWVLAGGDRAFVDVAPLLVGGSGGALAAITVNSTDAEGRPTSVTEDGVTTTYTYNPDGSVATETRNGITRTYSYDAAGNLTGATVA